MVLECSHSTFRRDDIGQVSTNQRIVDLATKVPIVFLFVSALGCSSQPPRVRTISVDDSAAAQQAMQTYDANGDGLLMGDELVACEGLRKSLGKIDQDGDGAISKEELISRFHQWTEQKMGIRSLKVVISMKGQPLSGADVEFVPESFMGEAGKSAFGFTNAQGVANMSHDSQDMPRGAENAQGVTNGFFRIKITHPKKKIPAKYNKKTILGQEVARDTIQSTMHLDL